MCGIVGYIGSESKARGVLIEGLTSLEYRGYDSSGIAIVSEGQMFLRKEMGGLDSLKEKIKDEVFDGSIGIGHTRWATHGAPSTINSHPHLSENGKIAVIHNGIIENYSEIKEWLVKEHKINFVSETDTEVIAQLIGVIYKGDLHMAVQDAVAKMRGAYALGVISEDEPDKIVAVRKDAPLVVGLGKGENYIASDVPAILKHTRKVYFIENDEIVVLTKNHVEIFDEQGETITHEIKHIDWDVNAAEKGGFEHFMLKEIHEQPKGIRETLNQRLTEDGEIKLDGISLTAEEIKNFSKVYIVACGTAYHAGLVGKYVIEKMAGIPVEIDVASEFRYRDPFVDEKTLFIAISQSGETLDTLAALREAKRKGARVLSIVNVVGSSVARESDDVFYTWAGPEIAVASTKAYTTQLLCLYLIALYMGKSIGRITDEYYSDIIEQLKVVPEKIEEILGKEDEIKKIAERFYSREKVFFIGRGTDAAVAYEASLKLKEISYINSFAIAAGELKHGTIALMEEEALVFALASQDFLLEKMVSNIEEIRARKAFVVGLAKEGKVEVEEKCDEILYVPDCADEISPLLTVIPMQIYSYYVALFRGCNIDKPKNLAKSVTVE